MKCTYFSASVYCLRCCNDPFSSYCDPTKDTQGCSGGIPGDTGSGFTDTTGTAAAPVPVVNYHGCAPKIDTCSGSGFVCCVSKGDASGGLSTKTTCQYSSDCVAGTIGVLPKPVGGGKSTTSSSSSTTVSSTATTGSVTATSSTTGSSSTSTSTTSPPNSGTLTLGLATSFLILAIFASMTL